MAMGFVSNFAPMSRLDTVPVIANCGIFELES